MNYKSRTGKVGSTEAGSYYTATNRSGTDSIGGSAERDSMDSVGNSGMCVAADGKC